ncbi:MAG TPA: hypothetical protein VND94_19005 [Terriglobia bacterium]|nr:hypothetical protein [Terriglobia bacterium]
MIKQVAQAVETVKQLTTLNGAVGMARQAVNATVGPWESNIGSTVSAVQPAFDTWKMAKSISPSISTPQNAQQFLVKALDFPAAKTGSDFKPVSNDEIQSMIQQRYRTQKEVAFRAMAAAEVALNKAPDASQHANTVMTGPNSDVRTQLAQIAQALNSINQELVMHRTLLAQQLELSAATEIKHLPTTTMQRVSEGSASNSDPSDGSNINPFQ